MSRRLDRIFVPNPVAVVGGGSEGSADISNTFSTNAGTAAHHLVQVYAYLHVVSALPVRAAYYVPSTSGW